MRNTDLVFGWKNDLNNTLKDERDPQHFKSLENESVKGTI